MLSLCLEAEGNLFYLFFFEQYGYQIIFLVTPLFQSLSFFLELSNEKTVLSNSVTLDESLFKLVFNFLIFLENLLNFF